MRILHKHLALNIALALAASALSSQSLAIDFRYELGPNRLEGLVDVEIAYGIRWRMEDQDPDLIGLGNGGNRSDNANLDDGNLNYDQGDPVSNMIRATGELTLRWGNWGAFFRGYGFYDYENEDKDRARTDLSSTARDQVGSDVELLDAYVSGQFDVREMPLQFRLGKQVVTWGESRFFSADGVNVANPLNLPLFLQPTGTPRDLRLPVGMLWGSLQPSPFFAIEGYYQYEWRKTVLPAVGTYFETADTLFPAGRIFQGGPFGDQGTDVDAAFGLPPGTVGFDKDFWQIPRSGADRPSEQGQFGLSLQMLIPKLNDTKFALQFANYHSKLPALGGISPSLEAMEAYSVQGIAAEAAKLVRQGVAPNTAAASALAIQFSEWVNNTRYFAQYPENIQMLGLSFNTTSLRTGTAYFGEIAHHFDAPMPIHTNQILSEIVPGSTPGGFFDIFPPVNLNEYSSAELTANFASKRIDFIKELDKTFLSLGATQLLGPRFGASQTALTGEVGWLHIWDFPSKSDLLIAGPGLAVTTIGPKSRFADADSWGYRLAGTMTYNNVFGGLTLKPRVIFSHDVNGISPIGVGPFLEDKKSLIVGLSTEYLQSVQADLSYTTFWDGGKDNLTKDRDFLTFSIRYDF